MAPQPDAPATLEDLAVNAPTFPRTLLVATVTAALLTACTSTPESAQLEDYPDWYQVYPEGDRYLYGFGEGHSSRASTATRQARLDARTELASSVNAHVQSMAQAGEQQMLDDPQVRGMFESASRELVDQSLSGTQADQVHRVRESDGSVRVFMRMRLPLDEGDRIGRTALENMDDLLSRRRQQAQ